MRLSAPSRPLLVALAGLLALSGCAVSAGTSVDSAESTVSAGTADPSSGLTESTPDSGPSSGDGGPTAGASAGPGGGPGDKAQPGTGGHPAPKEPASQLPTIVSFHVTQPPSCPSGTNVNPIEGSPVVVKWKVTNVDQVSLSVDGPGIYRDDYPPTGTETFSFPCSGAGGDIQKHTYQLTATNGAGKRTKSIVVTATVHEIAQV